MDKLIEAQKSLISGLISNLNDIQKYITDVGENNNKRELEIVEREEGLNKRQREIEILNIDAGAKLQKAEEILTRFEAEKTHRRLKIESIDNKFTTDLKVWQYLSVNGTPITFGEAFFIGSAFIAACEVEGEFYISTMTMRHYDRRYMIQFELIEDNVVQVYSTNVYVHAKKPHLYDGNLSMLLKPINEEGTIFRGEKPEYVKQHPMPKATIRKVENPN